MFNIDDQKGFNQSMNKYISSARRKESGILQRISHHFSKFHGKFKKHDNNLPENLSEHEIHVEEKKQGFFDKLLKGKTMKEQEHIEEEIENKPEEVQEKMDEVVEDYETLDEVEEEIEQKKEGLYAKFKKMLKSKPKNNKSEDVPIEQVQRVMEGKPANYSDDSHELKEDLKKVSKITLSVVHKLSHEAQEEFKNSHDFAEYKSILEKYNLVK